MALRFWRRPATETVSANPVSRADTADHSTFGLERGPMLVSDPEDLARGQSLGRYVIVARRGVGAMGVVYEAYDPELDRKVALKILSPRLRGSPRADEHQLRLLREAQSMARLSHPNVISVFDVGTFDGRVFVAMELLTGGTVRDWRKERPRGWREVLSVFEPAGRGLAAAHAAGLIHRDFKPDNLLFGASGQVRVTDFGLARTLEPSAEPPTPEITGPAALDTPVTRTGAIVGTLGYVSPEQLSGGEIDARSDQFAFCASLHEALFGALPFDAKTPEALLAQIQSGRLSRPASSPRVPARVRAAVLRGLGPDPQRRFPSMTELLDALSRPALTSSRVAAWSALGLGVASFTAVAVRIGRERVDDVCAHAGDPIAGAWSAAQKPSVHAAFLATGKPYAEDAWRAVERALDTYATSWAAESIAACRAGRHNGHSSPEILALKTLCLERQRAELSALTRIFAEATPGVVESSVVAVAALPEVTVCDDVSALTSRRAMPETSEQRRSVEAQRVRLSEADAFIHAGRADGALSRTEPALQEAERLRYSPLIAEALIARARAALLKGEVTAADADLRRATLEAEAARDDETSLRAWIERVSVEGERLGHIDEGLEAAQHAEALLKAVGGNDRLAVRLLTNRGLLLWGEGKYAEALAQMQQALILTESIYPADSIPMANALANVGLLLDEQGSFEQALGFQRSSLAILEKLLGPENPRLASPINRIGIILFEEGRYAEATTFHRRGLKLREDSFDKDHPSIGAALLNLAQDLSGQGQHDEALELARHSLEIHRKAFGADHLRMSAPLAIYGECLIRKGDVRQALPPLEQAVAILARTYGPNNSRQARYLRDLGDARRALNQAAEARALYARSLSLQENEVGADSLLLGPTLTRLGEVDLLQRNDARAQAELRRAVQLLESATSSPSDLAEARFALAQSLWSRDDARLEAAQLAALARDGFVRGAELTVARRSEVETWIARHPLR